MNKTATTLWFCICLSLAGWGQTNIAKRKPAGGVTQALIQQSLDAWSTMDTNRIATYYSKASGNVFFDVAPMEYKGWAEWEKGIHSLFSDYKSFKFSLVKAPAIHNLGNWAWSTELWHVDAVHKDGKPEAMDGRDTAVWQKLGGKWLIVHEHDSLPIPMPAGEKNAQSEGGRVPSSKKARGSHGRIALASQYQLQPKISF